MMDTVSCERCRFFGAFAGGEQGYCRRYAPRPTMTPTATVEDHAFFPVVMSNDWCGEWQVRTPSAPAQSQAAEVPRVLRPPKVRGK